MSGNNPFRQLNPSNPPPSPHRDNYHLEDSPPVHALTTEPESLYDEEPNQGQGYLAPSHELRPSSTPPEPRPPDFDTMPIPLSYLPPGAAPPQRFYGALGADADSRTSFESSSFSVNDPPRPMYGYHDSDHGSVSRLRRDSQDARSLATFDTRPSSRYGAGFGEYHDDMGRSGVTNEYQMEDLQQAQIKNALYAAPKDQKRKRVRTVLIVLGVLAALVAAGGLGYYFFVVRKHSSNTSGDGSSGGGSSSSPTSTATGHHDLIVTGGDGSTVTMDDGTTFVYKNSFGGTWYYDPNDPYNNNAQAQSYTPPLNKTFKPGTDRIYGFVSSLSIAPSCRHVMGSLRIYVLAFLLLLSVNLGGWLNTEPFISPALYEPYVSAATPAIDEWTLSVNMAADTARGGLNQLETHYATFIVRKTFRFASCVSAGPY